MSKHFRFFLIQNNISILEISQKLKFVFCILYKFHNSYFVSFVIWGFLYFIYFAFFYILFILYISGYFGWWLLWLSSPEIIIIVASISGIYWIWHRFHPLDNRSSRCRLRWCTCRACGLPNHLFEGCTLCFWTESSVWSFLQDWIEFFCAFLHHESCCCE